MTIYHLHPTTGKRRDAWRNSRGQFVLGDYNKYGEEQHTVENEVYAATEERALELIETNGHYIRVANHGKKDGLLRRNLFVDGRRLT